MKDVVPELFQYKLIKLYSDLPIWLLYNHIGSLLVNPFELIYAIYTSLYLSCQCINIV
jgi:hypothetical protein